MQMQQPHAQPPPAPPLQVRGSAASAHESLTASSGASITDGSTAAGPPPHLPFQVASPIATRPSRAGGRGALSPHASPSTSRARVPGGHGIPLSFGRATLPIPPPSPPPDMSPQGFTAKAAQAALAAAAAAANKAQERRVHQPAAGHELAIHQAMLRDAASVKSNAARTASPMKSHHLVTAVPQADTREASVGDNAGVGSAGAITADSSSASASAEANQMTAAEHERKRPIAFTPNTYKTEICRSHTSTGNCEYGAYCQFAHGVAELRARDFDVKYKTKLCKNFYETGHCRFSSRCKFIHDEQRVQVSESEFWLVSPSDNLVRVEVAHTPERRAQLQSLVTSTFTPPPLPYRGSPTYGPTQQPASAPLVPVRTPAGVMPPPLMLADAIPAPALPRDRGDDSDPAMQHTLAAFQNLAITTVPPPSPQLQVPYYQYPVVPEPLPPPLAAAQPPVFPVFSGPPALVPMQSVYPPPSPQGSPLFNVTGYHSPQKGSAPTTPLVLAAAPPLPPPPLVIAGPPPQQQSAPILVSSQQQALLPSHGGGMISAPAAVPAAPRVSRANVAIRSVAHAPAVPLPHPRPAAGEQKPRRN